MSNPQLNTLLHEKAGTNATIKLNRPDEANGLNLLMAQELHAVARQCFEDDSLKSVILTGEGRFFCAGGDIKSMQAYGDEVEAGLRDIADNLHAALSYFARMDAVLIVAVNGTAAGAGFSMAVAGDLVVATDKANFTMAYTKVGLSPDGSSSYYLPRLVGLRKAQELMLTNRVLSANDAHEWGLINQVVPADELMQAAQEWANMLAQGSRMSNSSVKKLLLHSDASDLESQMDLESRTIAANSATQDGREGVAAFLEKRKPEFS